MSRLEQIKTLDDVKNQIEEKDIIVISEEDDTYKCPTCGQIFTGNDIIRYGYRWCYSCGQKVNFILPRNRF